MRDVAGPMVISEHGQRAQAASTEYPTLSVPSIVVP